MATIKDISHRTGLGIATISKYLNGGNVRPENRIKIEKAVRELNYTVNEFARGLKTSKSKAVGVVLPEMAGTFFTRIITEVEDVLRKENYAVIVCDCRTDAKLEAEAVSFLLGKKVDGLINFAVNSSGDHLKPALEAGIPIVLIDRLIPRLYNKVDSIIIDNVSISREVTRLLLENGHRKIGIVVGPKDVYTAQKRLQGYCEELEDNGVPVNSKYIVHCEYTVESGFKGLHHLVGEAPELTAVYVTNHDMTLGALMALNERRMRVPGNISFVGFDSMDWAWITVPKLTIVAQPMEQIGKRAADIMLARLADGNQDTATQTIMLSATLMIGESIKKIPL